MDVNKDAKYNVFLLAAFICTVAGHITLAYFLRRDESWLLFAVFAGLFALYLYLCRQQVTEKQFTYLAAGCIMLRLIWLFSFPQLSDDYARFVWDGRLLIAGYNPYKYLPADIMKQGFPSSCIDPILYSSLNSQTYYTCYPPLLQAIFGIAAWLSCHNIYANIILLKFFIFAAEIGSVFLLMRLLLLWHMPRKQVMLYALNPIVIAELTGNVHYEGVMIFFLLAALYSLYNKQFILAVVTLTVAILTKLVPLMFLPLLFFYFKPRKGLLFCLGVLLLFIICWLPFFDFTIMQKFWLSLDSYFQESEYNASIYYLVRNIVYHFTHENEIEIIGPVLTITSGVLIFIYAFCKRKYITIQQLPKYFTWTLLLYYAFTTTVFPWYLTPVVLCAVFTGYYFPLVWSAMIVLSYYTDRNNLFEESNIILWLEYSIVAGTMLFDIYNEKKVRMAINI